jgi:hypothetical protein
VRIISPHHPLCGTVVSVIRRIAKQRDPQIVVLLPDGHTQALSASWTEPELPIVETSTHQLSTTPPLFFTSASLRTLCNMVEHLKQISCVSKEVSHDTTPPFPASNLGPVSPNAPATIGSRLVPVTTAPLAAQDVATGPALRPERSEPR